MSTTKEQINRMVSELESEDLVQTVYRYVKAACEMEQERKANN